MLLMEQVWHPRVAGRPVPVPGRDLPRPVMAPPVAAAGVGATAASQRG